jgi:hypothetical protein
MAMVSTTPLKKPTSRGLRFSLTHVRKKSASPGAIRAAITPAIVLLKISGKMESSIKVPLCPAAVQANPAIRAGFEKNDARQRP